MNPSVFNQKLLITILVLSMLSACVKKEYEVIENYDDAGQLKETYTVRLTDAVQHGAYTKYFEGRLSETGFYKNGVQDSIRIIYHANGEKQIEEYYNNGKIEGTYKAYFDNGQLEEEGQYNSEHVMEGAWKYYYKNGQLKEKITFKNNVENGPFIQYYANGNKQAEGTYAPLSIGVEEEGAEQGELKEYNDKGELLTIKDCNLGRCKTVWRKGIGAVASPN